MHGAKVWCRTWARRWRRYSPCNALMETHRNASSCVIATLTLDLSRIIVHRSEHASSEREQVAPLPRTVGHHVRPGRRPPRHHRRRAAQQRDRVSARLPRHPAPRPYSARGEALIGDGDEKPEPKKERDPEPKVEPTSPPPRRNGKDNRR